MLLHSNTTSLLSDSHNMLSFSSPNTHQTLALPYYAPNTTGSVRGVRGPFTPSQWMELEHQALIYKYITLKAPIPSNLLIPIRKALESSDFSAYPGTHLRHTTYGWGGFHLGFSNNSDPEPGRCRRTDGKKWRCSRDAVADQKYCERHMNRGRHRSRKPVEGQTGHSVSNGPTTTTAAAKLSASATVVTTTSTIVAHLHQFSSGSRMQPSTTPNPATFSHDNGSFLNKENMKSEKIEDATGRSILSSSSIGLKENPLSVSVPTPSEFGLVCSDSLVNPLHKKEDGIQKSQNENSLRQFMDDWPHSDKTQLSISIPLSSSDLMSSTSSPNLSPLRMGMGDTERLQQANWIPVSWESSMGGPLGEVLHHSRTNSPSALNLMTDACESSQHMSLSSPTGVLQKTAFGSVSNSSAGSSPKTDHNLLITSPLPWL
ncbi:hypothetical protein L1887_44477 [Cichorium endivia]|nr:hypothetical protein L1887_44477 [Cichorium endivia]